MSETVSLSRLIVRLSQETGADANTSRVFVRELFAAVAETMAEGETVELPGIGTFKRSSEPSDDGQPRVLYLPDSALADAVNAPFSMFEPREVPDDFTTADVDKSVATPPIAPEQVTPEDAATEVEDTPKKVAEETNEPTASTVTVSEPQNVPVSETEEAPSVSAEVTATAGAEDAKADTAEVAASVVHIDTVMSDEAAVEEHNDSNAVTPSFPEEDAGDASLPEPESPHSLRWLWIIIAALAVGIAVGIYAGLTVDVSIDEDPAQEPVEAFEPADNSVVNEPGDAATASEQEAAEQSNITSSTQHAVNTSVSTASDNSGEAGNVHTVEAATADETDAQSPVYETVSSTNYLSTMARRHYGKSVYWVYIYEANAEKLGHPDRIAPGTRLLIPPKSSFPQAASEAEALEMAQRKAVEIQARFH